MISNEIAIILYIICSILILVIGMIMAGIIIFSVLELIIDHYEDHRR